MELTLGFSTCPNDTFIFDAMVNGKIDTCGLGFNFHLADVEELNRKAFSGEADITKISFHAYAHIADKYRLLNSGSALGRNNGPLLVAGKKYDSSEINGLKIAIPGKYTTANLLFRIAWPEAVNRVEYLFSDIEDAVLGGEVDAGLIIHENRFTYEKRGLVKIVDMGEYWEQFTGSPVPLGGIAVNRRVPEEIAQRVDTIIAESIRHSMANPDSPYRFIRKYAVTMEREVMENHIRLYVNDFTAGLGKEGRESVRRLYYEAVERDLIPAMPEDIFVTSG